MKFLLLRSVRVFFCFSPIAQNITDCLFDCTDWVHIIESILITYIDWSNLFIFLKSFANGDRLTLLDKSCIDSLPKGRPVKASLKFPPQFPQDEKRSSDHNSVYSKDRGSSAGGVHRALGLDREGHADDEHAGVDMPLTNTDQHLLQVCPLSPDPSLIFFISNREKSWQWLDLTLHLQLPQTVTPPPPPITHQNGQLIPAVQASHTTRDKEPTTTANGDVKNGMKGMLCRSCFKIVVWYVDYFVPHLTFIFRLWAEW